MAVTDLFRLVFNKLQKKSGVLHTPWRTRVLRERHLRHRAGVSPRQWRRAKKAERRVANGRRAEARGHYLRRIWAREGVLDGHVPYRPSRFGRRTSAFFARASVPQ